MHGKKGFVMKKNDHDDEDEEKEQVNWLQMKVEKKKQLKIFIGNQKACIDFSLVHREREGGFR